MKENNVLTDVYRDILRIFQCNEPQSESMQQPFFQEEFVVATDRYGMVCFKKELLKTVDFTSHEKAPNALGIIPTEGIVDIDLDVNTLREGIVKSNKAVKDRYREEECECPDCEGRGMVDYVFRDYKGKDHEIEENCPTCAYETNFTMVTEIQTGNHIDAFQELVKVDDCCFDVKYFEKVIKIAELLGVKTIKITNKTHVCKFVIAECTVCIIIKSYDEDDVITIIS